MNVPLVLLLVYTVGITAFGVWIGRRVRGPADFFVAGRKLTWPLVGGTVLAANIGAGTTVGAASVAYRDGISAWWWNGAAGLGTLVLALWVGPKLWALASARGHLTIGDFLEERYSATVRAVIAVLIAIGTLAILAGQLIAGAAVLDVVAGMPRWQGVAIGGVAMTLYFTAGGLLSSAWVNAVQLVVLLGGFIIALPLVLAKVGGTAAISAASGVPDTFWDPMYSAGAFSGWTMLILLGPGFVISPGLVGKAYGAESIRALKIGLSVAAIAQLIFSFFPVLLGMAARVNHPGIDNLNVVLPTVMLHELPVVVGALALAAVFSAEVSTCDAILYMLATSSSKDLYQRFVNPAATPDQVLRVARIAALIGGVLGMILAVRLATIVDALRIFYSLLGASLFVPVLGALLWPRAGAREAMGGIIGGVGTLLAVYFGTDRTGWADPSLWGLFGSAAGFAIAAAMPRAGRAALSAAILYANGIIICILTAPWHVHHGTGISHIGRQRFLITTITRNRVKAFANIDFGQAAAAELLRHAADEFSIPAYTFMEDHVHLATKGLTAQADLCSFIAEWKKSTGFLWSKRGFGRLSQPGFWDRRVRFDESPLVMLKYVVENPVRAKLVAHPSHYVLTGSTEFTVDEICAAIAAGGSGGIKVPPSR